MADPRVAVYIDFDNIVISRYDQVHGRDAWRKDNARDYVMGAKAPDAVSQRLDEARVDIGAILEYAASFGTVTVSRAYADWSVPANASYRVQLVDRSIDLTQLFNASGTKNGADIRLAVDVVDDLFRLESITDVIIVAGDSDYIPMVQRCKRMGRRVIGVGIVGSTAKSLVNACDVFTYYDDIPGLAPRKKAEAAPAKEPAKSKAKQPDDASALLVRALELLEKNGEDWQTNGEVKNVMVRLNSSFNEKALGFSTFSKFLQSRADQGVIEINPEAEPNHRRLRLPES
jgi:hypothetical protein